MKKQVKLTQSDLYNVIKESVKKVILEFGTDQGELGDKNRTLMAMAAKRGLENNNSTIYDNAYQSITHGGAKDGLTRDETIGVLNDFQKKFEGFNEQPANDLAANEGRMAFKVNEAQLKAIIRESVNIILNEIGDTPKGNFALNAVRGRRAAKRYRTNMNLKDRADNDRVIGIAGDTIYKNYCKNHELGLDNEAGYRYGFDKGVEKYENK